MQRNLFFIFLLTCGIAFPCGGAMLDDALRENEQFSYSDALKNLVSQETGTPDKYLAWQYLRDGNCDRAIELFSGLDASDYEVPFGLGLAHFLEDDPDSAFQAFTDCLSVNRHCAAAEYFRGLIASGREPSAEAVKHYKRALELDYNLTEARLRLAELYYSLKRYNDAFREWSSIADMDPDFKVAREKKQELLKYITKKPEEIIPPKRIIRATAISPAPNAETIPLLRIGIIQNVKEIKLWAPEGIEVYSGNERICTTAANELLTINSSSDPFRNRTQLLVKPVSSNTGIVVRDIRYAGGFAWAGISDREYRGTLEINLKKDGFSVINLVNLEEYLYSVLPSEMISWWPEEALKVQAVITRTQALYRKDIARLHKKNGFDLCSDQHCQVYKGIKQETAKARKAVDTTRGEILACQGKVIHALFSSNCSGHTQSSKELKGWGDEPFLRGIKDGDIDFPASPSAFDAWIKHAPDIFCAPSKYTYYAESRWIRVISQEELSERLNRNHDLGSITKIIPLKRSASGHINHLRIVGREGEIEIEKENVIRSLALGRLRSTNFIVEGYGTDSGVPKYFIFWGAGWGHAVGLCQSGVAGMSEKGYSYQDILKQYYTGAEIKNVAY